MQSLNMDMLVAPHTGAWIETGVLNVPSVPPPSHPTRVRGLKLKTKDTNLDGFVAPHTGAWIETFAQQA